MERRTGISDIRKPRASERGRRGKRDGRALAQEAVAFLLFVAAVFAAVALATYHPLDASLFSSARSVSHNACGKVGAFLSALFLQTLGMGALALPLGLLLLAAASLRREHPLAVALRLLGYGVAVLSATVLLSIHWPEAHYAGSALLTGGVVGTLLARELIAPLQPVGASLVAFAALVLSLTLSTPLSLIQLGARVLGWTARALATGALKLAHALWVGALRLAVRLQRGAQSGLVGLLASARERALQRAALAEERARVAALLEGVAGGDSHEPPESPELEDSHDPLLGAEDSEVPAVQASATPERAGKPLAILPPERTGLGATADRDAMRTSLSKIAARAAKLGPWKLPTIEFLKRPPRVESGIDRERLTANSRILEEKFADFGIDGEVTAVRPGPVITLYEFKPGPGVKVSRIAALADDLSMALSAQSVRILAPLPGKSVVGIEIPSDTRETVYLREFLQHPDFYGAKHAIPVTMGKDIAGQTVLSDLARMPHLLVAGQTGAGKSVFMNGLICSLFYRFTPDELRMILVDPKFIEFRSYQDIPHLLLPVVDDPKHASTALKWAVREMERRYRILAKLGARNLASFNQKVDEMGADVVRDLLLAEDNQSEPQFSHAATAGSDWIEAFEPDDKGAPRVGKLPFIVVIIDELADLMMVARKEVEISIARIAQKARAAGIHLVIATQRPSTDVITGLIKANLPSRVSFQLASFVDSKTILDRAGAERLLGQGDMLFIPPGVSQPARLHGAFVDDDEIQKITSFLKSQGKPAYRDEILVDEEEDGEEGDGDNDSDELFEQAVELVKRSGHASASFLQRHLKVGYNRAARMIETMESRGIVGPAEGARPREVLLR